MEPSPISRESSHIESVARILEGYAARGVFRGFSRQGVSSFKMVWHRDRLFELILDVPKKTMRFPLVLPEVPSRSAMYREFKEFLASLMDDSLPDHRRIDRRKARLQCANRGGNISVTLTVVDGDFEYGARKLIHAVHEIFLTFLTPYHEYMVETFDLDPDHV